MSQRKIYIFNIGIEEKLDISSNVYSHISNKKLEKAVSSMEQMCLLHANIDDVVIFENVVPIEVLESIRKIKDLPTILYCKRGYLLENDKIIIELRNLAKVSDLCLYPYAITEEINKFAEKLGCNCFGAERKLSKMLNDKCFTKKMSIELGLPSIHGCITNDISKIKAFALDSFKSNRKIVIKRSYGASGKGLYIFSNLKQLNRFLRKIGNQLLEEVIVETWLDNSTSINYQLVISPSCVVINEPTIQLVQNGVYRGSIFGKGICESEHLNCRLQHYINKIVKRLEVLGYEGIVSIDAIISERGEIYPCIEINARFSLSTYLNKIPELFGPGFVFSTMYFDLASKDDAEKVMKILFLYGYDPLRKQGMSLFVYSKPEINVIGRVFVLFIAKCKITLLNYMTIFLDLSGKMSGNIKKILKEVYKNV